jgi:alkyl sulfatase BDS1-like metallo-beta-lactamase superfamily hydrolase
LLAPEVLDKLVHAEPRNQSAKDLLADVFEQIGYQQENPGLRNSFLAGALELREGIPEGALPKSSGPDVIRAMSTELFLDFLGVRMDSRKAEGDVSFLAKLASAMVDFDPRFEILPGTRGKEEVLHANAYEAVPGKTIPE